MPHAHILMIYMFVLLVLSTLSQVISKLLDPMYFDNPIYKNITIRFSYKLLILRTFSVINHINQQWQKIFNIAFGNSSLITVQYMF